MQVGNKKIYIRKMLITYDLIIFLIADILLLWLYSGSDKLTYPGLIQHGVLSAACVMACRMAGKVYNQVWRYGGIQCYIRLILTDAAAFFVYLLLAFILPIERITFARMLSLICVNLLGSLSLRMFYRYAYKCGNNETRRGRLLAALLRIFSGLEPGRVNERSED